MENKHQKSGQKIISYVVKLRLTKISPCVKSWFQIPLTEAHYLLASKRCEKYAFYQPDSKATAVNPFLSPKAHWSKYLSSVLIALSRGKFSTPLGCTLIYRRLDPNRMYIVIIYRPQKDGKLSQLWWKILAEPGIGPRTLWDFTNCTNQAALTVPQPDYCTYLMF